MLKNCASFQNCITEVIITQVHKIQDTDVVMPLYNLVKYSIVIIIQNHQKAHISITEINQI